MVLYSIIVLLKIIHAYLPELKKMLLCNSEKDKHVFYCITILKMLCII